MSKKEKVYDKVDWNKVWSKQYPILSNYNNIEGVEKYANEINNMYDKFKDEFNLDDTNAVLILKDILYQKYKQENKKK